MSYNYVHKLRVRLYFFIYEIYFMLSISLECLLIFDCDKGFESIEFEFEFDLILARFSLKE